MKKTVICISRTYGSRGRSIGRKLAEELGIPFYDKAIIEMTAEKSGLPEEYIDHIEKDPSSSFLFNLANSDQSPIDMFSQYDVPTTKAAFTAQVAVIKEIAERSSCVIVGRCSDYILRGRDDCFSIFIYADKARRVRYLMDEYGVDAQTAEAKLTRIDKERANYYKNFTGETWGNIYAHDLSINSSRCGVDGTAAVIKSLIMNEI